MFIYYKSKYNSIIIIQMEYEGKQYSSKYRWLNNFCALDRNTPKTPSRGVKKASFKKKSNTTKGEKTQRKTKDSDNYDE